MARGHMTPWLYNYVSRLKEKHPDTLARAGANTKSREVQIIDVRARSTLSCNDPSSFNRCMISTKATSNRLPSRSARTVRLRSLFSSASPPCKRCRKLSTFGASFMYSATDDLAFRITVTPPSVYRPSFEPFTVVKLLRYRPQLVRLQIYTDPLMEPCYQLALHVEEAQVLCARSQEPGGYQKAFMPLEDDPSVEAWINSMTGTTRCVFSSISIPVEFDASWQQHRKWERICQSSLRTH